MSRSWRKSCKLLGNSKKSGWPQIIYQHFYENLSSIDYGKDYGKLLNRLWKIIYLLLFLHYTWDTIGVSLGRSWIQSGEWLIKRYHCEWMIHIRALSYFAYWRLFSNACHGSVLRFESGGSGLALQQLHSSQKRGFSCRCFLGGSVRFHSLQGTIVPVTSCKFPGFLANKNISMEVGSWKIQKLMLPPTLSFGLLGSH